MKSLKLFFLFVVVIILMCIILMHNEKIIQINNIEKYANYKKNKYTMSYNFANKNEACDIFIKYHGNYFDKLQSYESVARKCINNINEYETDTIRYKCQKHYCNNVLDFTIDEQIQLQYVIELLEKEIIKNIRGGTLGIREDFNTRKHFNEWNFVKTSDLVENELPHTVNKYIIISTSFLEQMNDLIADDNKKLLLKNIGATLLHEQIHISQRKNKKIFDTLYSKYWNFKKLHNVPIDGYIKEKQRLNPDGMELNWGFQLALDTYLIPIVLLKNVDEVTGKNANLERFDKYGLVLKENKIIKREQLNIFSNYINYFCGISNNYHPNELSATLISEYLLNNLFNYNVKCSAIKNMVHWFNENFE